jgi:hypothetical protein
MKEIKNTILTERTKITDFDSMFPSLINHTSTQDIHTHELKETKTIDPLFPSSTFKEMKVNNKIYDFYQSNPQLNFEKINMDLINIIENMSNTEFISTPMPYLKSLSMEILLSKMYPCNEIIINNDKQKNYDYVLKRNNTPNVLFMCKTDMTNIESSYTDLFQKHVKETTSNGIFISQYSGIITKPDFQIDIINNNIVVYIHNCNYDIEKIKNAINIIDVLNAKLKISTEQQFTIESDVLHNINNEYQIYLNCKEQLIKTIQDSYKQIINKLEKCNFPTLETYLSKNFINKEYKQKYTCDICTNYISYTLKGMAAHKKGCKRKNAIVVV